MVRGTLRGVSFAEPTDWVTLGIGVPGVSTRLEYQEAQDGFLHIRVPLLDEVRLEGQQYKESAPAS